MTESRTLEEFYDADPRRRRSPEADFGVHWRLDGKDWPRWRVSYVQATGEVYAVCQRGNPLGPVRVLGVVPPDHAELGAVSAAQSYDGRYYRTLDEILAGWADPAVSGFDLAWIRQRLTSTTEPPPVSGLQWQQVTCSRCHWTYQCTPDDDYFGGPDGQPPAGPEAGVCFACLLTLNGMDVQKTQVMVLDADGNDIDPRDGSG